MSDKTDLASKIKSWLGEEEDLDFEFNALDQEELFRASASRGPNHCDIIISKKNPTSITLESRIRFEKKTYSSLKSNSRLNFVYKAEYALLLLGTNFTFSPNSTDLEEIRIWKVLYEDSLAKQSFFDAVSLVMRAFHMVNLQFAWEVRVMG